MSKVFLYAEFQIAKPFDELDWKPINVSMKRNAGLISKTWLSGMNNNTLGGFYEFDSVENVHNYIENELMPFSKTTGCCLSVKVFDGEITQEASRGMDSPFYP